MCSILCSSRDINNELPKGYQIGDIVQSLVKKSGPHINDEDLRSQNDSSSSLILNCLCCGGINSESPETALLRKVEILEEKLRKGIISLEPEIEIGDKGIIVGSCPQKLYPNDYNNRIIVEFNNGLRLALLMSIQVKHEFEMNTKYHLYDKVYSLVNRNGPSINNKMLYQSSKLTKSTSFSEMNSSSSCYCCCCCNESSNKNHESFEHHIEKKIEILEDKKRKGLLSSIPHVSEGDEGIIIGTCLKEVFPYDSHKRLLIKFHKQNIILALLYQTEISSIWPPSSSPPSTNQKEDNVSVQLENEFNTVILGTDMDTCISKNNIMNRHLANEQEQNNEIDSDNNFKIKRIDNNDRPKLSKKYSRIQSQYNQKTLMKQSSINGDNKTSNVLSTDASTSSSTSPSSSSSISRSPRKKSPPPSRQLKSRISSRETSSTSTFYSQRASSLPRPSTSSSTLSSTSTTDNESSSVDNKMIRESSSMPRSNQSKSLLKNDETFKEVEEEKDDEEEEEEEEERIWLLPP